MTPPSTGTLDTSTTPDTAAAPGAPASLRIADATTGAGAATRSPKPLTDGSRHTLLSLVLLWTYVAIPFLAVLLAVPVAWGWGLGWSDVAIAVSFYLVSGAGVTVGFHRYFTHGSFRAKRWLRIVLAMAGSLAIEGSVVQWVADHRRHHAFSDKEGDPHSPWAFGSSVAGLTKGFFHAHVGWLFTADHTNAERFAPDLTADRDIARISALFPLLVLVSTVSPGVIGGLVTWSWTGALTAFFWGTLVRIALLHHITWSVNSVCHIVGDRPFRSNDKAANFWPLAILSFGESWHNLHHADPTCARHGVLPGQIDISARIIWVFERFGWAYAVKWPRADRLAAKRIA
jgi:stearoyl-CoA desaturase (delta-9 desaturase)